MSAAAALERVIQGITDGLATIDEAAGYHNTMARVGRYDIREVSITNPYGMSYRERPCVCVEYAGATRDIVGEMAQVHLNLNLYAFTGPFGTDDDPVSSDARIIALETDLYGALAQVLDAQGAFKAFVLESFNATPLQHEDDDSVLDGVVCRVSILFSHPLRDQENASNA